MWSNIHNNGQVSSEVGAGWNGRAMLAAERRSRIQAELRRRPTAVTEQLAALCGASPETIRRDLVAMEARGLLTRVHGGAVGPGGDPGEGTFAERSAQGETAKVTIARLAAGLVRTGQTVIIDIGTTALHLARAFPADFRGTVATPSLLAAAELAGRPGIEVLVAGGRVRGGDLACSNAQTVGFFRELRADIAFLGSGGVDVAAGLTDYHLDEVATRRVMVAQSARSFVLADAGKLGRVAPHAVCGLSNLAGLVTDSEVPAALRTAVERFGGAVLAA